MSDKKTWVRFKLAGASFGFAHHIGEVAELSEKDAEKLTEAGATVPAKADEIAAAKAVIEAEKANAKPAAAPPANWQEQFDTMQKQIADLVAAAAPKK